MIWEAMTLSSISTRQAYGDTLVKLGDLMENVVVLDADVSKSTKTDAFAKRFPKRFFNMGSAEQNLIGTSCGLALCNKIPFVSTFAIFAAGRGFEIIRNSVCHANLNVKICATHSGITVGKDGATHQSIEDISIMRSIPNMTVLVPADGVETEKMILEIANMKGPVYVRLGRNKVPKIFDDSYEFKIGKGNIIREGREVSIIACGIMLDYAIKASKILELQGISARVVNMSTIKPIDRELVIDCAIKTYAIVTVEEHSTIGGLGSAVAEIVAEECPVLVKRIGINDVFGESGDSDKLLEEHGLTVENIVYAVMEVLRKK